MSTETLRSPNWKKSIKGKVVLQVSGLLSAAMLFIILVVAFLTYRQMSQQMETLLRNTAFDTQQRLEERIRYLVENSELLARNELLVNALLDTRERQAYLPSLTANFMEGKDVVSLSIVDFDGRPIFQTQDDIPRYNASPQLRAALAMQTTSLYLRQATHDIVVVIPVEYYSTTQGALVIVFSTAAIARNAVPNDMPVLFHILSRGAPVFEYAASGSEHYHRITLEPHAKTPYLAQLEFSTQLGLPESSYLEPVRQAMVYLLLIGFLFVVAGLVLSFLLADSITRPIIELHQRVTRSEGIDYLPCAPLGSGDELEALAEAFDERSLSLQHLARHDPLTGLPNRLFFLDRLDNAIKHSQRERTMLAVLFIDLDRFKEINDSLGHSIGDRLLINVARLLTAHVRQSDTVARLGGDEYAILIEGIENETTLISIINNLMLRFNETVEIEHFRLFTSSSIGVAIYPQNGTTTEVLLKNADAAMYKAKESGRNNYRFYSDSMTEQAYNRMNRLNQLHTALNNGEFVVYYQPQVDMRSGAIIGMESLIRWYHPKEGLIPPDQFIPLAEETGLLIDIDRWVMKTAMDQVVAWSRAGFVTGKLSLNLSMLQLRHSDFIDNITRMIAESEISPSQVQFEITETQIMQNPEEAIAMLHHLKQLGITIAIDDFGTGQSSLSYLKRLPVDKLKIDRTFVQGLPDDHDDVQLSRTIIAMATNMNLEMIAEGVETAEQAAFLVEHGCVEAQGYLYYRPMSAPSLEEHLERAVQA